jgi:hypothetical protein
MVGWGCRIEGSRQLCDFVGRPIAGGIFGKIQVQIEVEPRAVSTNLG